MVDQTLCPANEERERNVAAMEAYDDDMTGAITNDDPRGQYTYGEFPFDSVDLLVDRALDFVKYEDMQRPRTMVDLGSGSGRLVFYAALTRKRRNGEDEGFDEFHGVEIGTQFHSLAANGLRRGIEQGLFEEEESISGDSSSDESSSSLIEFHNGNALPEEDPYYALTPSSTSNAIQSLLSRTDLLFAYSTVWETNAVQPFHPELGAMILSEKWSKTLASICPNGCVAITTDRALNPDDGWRLLDRMDVENPAVWGSVGYISVLEK